MLDEGAQIDLADFDGKAALHHATNSCSYQCVQILLERGATLNIANLNGEIPLHEAVKSQSSEGAAVIELLIKCGSNIDAPDLRGDASFHGRSLQ